MDTDLKHKASFGGKIKFYKRGSIILLIISLLCIIIIVTMSDTALFDFALGLLCFGAAILIAFAILYGMLIKRIEKTGSFEEIDVINNMIYYVCEKSGERIITPESIESMKIYKTDSRHSDDIYYNVKIKMKDSGEIFMASRWVSDYRGLVRKMRIFKENNNLS